MSVTVTWILSKVAESILSRGGESEEVGERLRFDGMKYLTFIV